MAVKIKFKTLTNEHFRFNAATFVPDSKVSTVAIFTHGYTASKTDTLSWAQRLSDVGMACIIFDLPGHYLGSINEVESFEIFTEYAHHCFETAYNDLCSELNMDSFEHIIIGGKYSFIIPKEIEEGKLRDIKL